MEQIMVWVVAAGVFLILLYYFPRAVGALALIFGAAIGSILLWTNYEAAMLDRQARAILIDVTYNLERCRLGEPLMIEITNNFDKTLTKVTFGVEGYRVGHSDPLYYSDSYDYRSDRIIEKGGTWVDCWKLPKVFPFAEQKTIRSTPISSVTWKVKNIYPQFADD